MRSKFDSVSTASQTILFIQHMLTKIDYLQVPVLSRCHLQSILCRQVARCIESAMPCRAGHGDRTAHYSLALGEAVGLSRDQLHHLELAALLHDLGLLTLPRHIASAQDCLDMDDYALFQSHPRAGAHLLEPHRFLRIAARWIALHHERWDGYGYPFGLRGEFIPLGARILAVADTFDALCSRSSCHDAFTQEDVLALLLNRAGSQLDPHLVETFSAGVAQTTDFRSATSGRWFGEG